MYREARLEGCVQDNIIWEFDLQREFIGQRQTGTGFVIDVLYSMPRLALCRMKMNYSTSSTTLAEQPPRELLLEALRQQGVNTAKDDLYQISMTIKSWIEEKLPPK